VSASHTPSSPVVIIGGGFSGAMLAARLAEKGQASILIERSGVFGLGVAYSAQLDDHRLNVRTERMGAVAGQIKDFQTWMANHHPDRAAPSGFAPRRLYGVYVQDRLAAVETAHPGLIHKVSGEAVKLDGTTAILSDGRAFTGRAVVLATGNPAPKTISNPSSPRILANPWAKGALEQIGARDDVIILGTGLTMVDVILQLDRQNWQGRAYGVSRRGQLPRAHGREHEASVFLPDEAFEGPLSSRLKAVRKAAKTAGWRSVMEAYRPITIELWRAASEAERSRFVRHLRPWWDVHRHRIDPEVADRLQALLDEGRLIQQPGHVRAMRGDDTSVEMDVKPRKGDPLTLQARWLIDCTGPGHDALSQPLTRGLIEAGKARLDGLRLGLDLDEVGHVLDAEGRANPALFVLGPPARAALWETIAVPDIRNRIEIITDQLMAD
jgi:uncharacterized NAD(P)/FAD-binding protein YdhS